MRRLGPLGFLALGGVAAIVRWLLFPARAGLPRLRCVLQGLHAFTFGAVYIGNQHAIARAVPEELTASAQGVFAMVVGLFMALATLAAGPLYETFGGNAFARDGDPAGAGAGRPRRLSPPSGGAENGPCRLFARPPVQCRT